MFANKEGKPLDRHNLLHRHVKKTAEKLNVWQRKTIANSQM